MAEGLVKSLARNLAESLPENFAENLAGSLAESLGQSLPENLAESLPESLPPAPTGNWELAQRVEFVLELGLLRQAEAKRKRLMKWRIGRSWP